MPDIGWAPPRKATNYNTNNKDYYHDNYKYSGRKLFCDYLNGQKHQKRCEAEAIGLTREALTVAVNAVHETS